MTEDDDCHFRLMKSGAFEKNSAAADGGCHNQNVMPFDVVNCIGQ
jgi:hypothetical protein